LSGLLRMLVGMQDAVTYSTRVRTGWRSVAEAVVDELFPLACSMDIDVISHGVQLPDPVEAAMARLIDIAKNSAVLPLPRVRARAT
jgi:hypothetical protein